jgi:hypothetical protein
MRHDPATLDRRAARDSGAILFVRDTLHLRQVLAKHAVTGVRDPHGEIAVVGQNHQPFGKEIEPSHRVDPLVDPAAQQGEHRWAPFRVLRGGDETRRLVEKDVAKPLRQTQTLAVDLDRIALEVGPVAELRPTAVDRHPALADHLLGFAPRTDPRPCDELLHSFKAH